MRTHRDYTIQILVSIFYRELHRCTYDANSNIHFYVQIVPLNSIYNFCIYFHLQTPYFCSRILILILCLCASHLYSFIQILISNSCVHNPLQSNWNSNLSIWCAHRIVTLSFKLLYQFPCLYRNTFLQIILSIFMCTAHHYTLYKFLYPFSFENCPSTLYTNFNIHFHGY